MPTPTLVNLSSLIDDAKCYELVRQHRWPEGARCRRCGGAWVARHGRDDTQPHRQRYRCAACGARFDDLTGTVLAGRHQPLRVWVLCLYFMGLNLSNRQIARELGLSQPDVQLMTEQLRHGLAARLPAATLEGEVEIDEVYVVAGHTWIGGLLARRPFNVVVAAVANKLAQIAWALFSAAARPTAPRRREHTVSGKGRPTRRHEPEAEAGRSFPEGLPRAAGASVEDGVSGRTGIGGARRFAEGGTARRL